LERGRMMGILGTSYTLGSALAILAVGAALKVFGGWRVAFVAPAIALAASSAYTAARLRETPSGEAGSPRDAASTAAHLSLRESLAATLGNPAIWILGFGLFGLDAVRYGFIDWAPRHLADTYGSDALPAAIKTAVFP